MLITLIGDGGVFTVKPILDSFAAYEWCVGKLEGDSANQSRLDAIDAKLQEISPLAKTLRLGFRVHSFDPSLLDVSVEGDFLGKLYDLLHYSTFADYLQLSAKLLCQICDDDENRQPIDFCKEIQLLPTLVTESPNAIVTTGCTQFLATGIDLQLDPNIAQGVDPARQTWHCTFQLQLVVDDFDYESISHLVPTARQISERLLRPGPLRDFRLVDKEGGSFPCNKSFLAARSPVFSRKFRNGTTNEEHLSDMSAESVNAFLRYVYLNDVTTAVQNSAIAVDLYELGRRYRIHDLVALMREFFIRKPSAWLGAGNANRLLVTLTGEPGARDGELMASIRNAIG